MENFVKFLVVLMVIFTLTIVTISVMDICAEYKAEKAYQELLQINK